MVEPFADLVAQIKADRGRRVIVPTVDPTNGNERATFLLLLESPGPKAVQTGVISLDNPDPTASNLKMQLAEAGIEREQVAMWNVVPWFLDPVARQGAGAPTSAEIEMGCSYLPPLLDRMPDLHFVVLLGGTARRAHVFLSHTTTARIVSCHHASAIVMNPAPWKAEENVAVFRFIARTT